MNYENTICPIYFEDHHFGGHVSSIENFTNLNLGTVRTTFLNRRPYFCAMDICKGLCLNATRTTEFVSEAVNDILDTYTTPPTFQTRGCSDTPLTRIRGYQNANIPGTVSNIDPEELYFIIPIEITHPIGNSDKMVTQKVNTIFISEPVLYMLTFRSRKKEAVAFKAWLAVEILPNLRALGYNNIPNVIGSEYFMIVNSIRKINSIYDKMENYDAAESIIKSAIHDIKMGQRSENESVAHIEDALSSIFYKMNNIDNKEDYLFSSTMELHNKSDGLLNNTAILNDKVTNIASGLNMVFGQTIKK